MKQVSLEQLRGTGYRGKDAAASAMYQRNQMHLDNLLADAKRRQITPFIGAGYSAGIYPLWRNLILNWARELGESPYHTIRSLVESGDLEEAASELVRVKGKNAVKNDLLLSFGKSTLDQAIRNISPERAGLWQAFQGPILTTNYDRLIERIYSDAGIDLEVNYPYIDNQHAKSVRTLQRGENALFKLHGDCEDPDNVIFTSESYDKAYGISPDTKYLSELANILSKAFGRNQVLFLGCSLESDRTLKVLSSDNDSLWHYAIVELPVTTRNKRNPFAPYLTVDGKVDEQYLVKSKRLMETFHIRPIWYPSGEHLCLDTVLGWLEREINLPARSRRPFGRIPRSSYELVGREKEVNEIVKRCSTPKSITVVSGLGGMGKTEVCKTALRRLYDSGHDIIYAVAIDARSALDQCDSIAKALQVAPLNHSGTITNETYLSYLFDAATAKVSLVGKASVLYIDNWDTAWSAHDSNRDAIVDILYYFANRGFSVVVSCRSKLDNYEIGTNILLNKLSLSNSKRLYMNVIKSLGCERDGLSKDDRNKLLRNLSGYPLAIILTARQIVYAVDVKDVLDHWVLSEQHARDPRHNSLSEALNITWRSVSECSYAQQAWGVIALSPTGIPLSELMAIVKGSHMDEAQWNDAIRMLRNFDIVSCEEGLLDMLPPIREVCFTFPEKASLYNAYDLLGRSYITLLRSSSSRTSLEKWSETRKQVSANLYRMLELLRRSLVSTPLNDSSKCPVPRYAYALAQYYSLDPAASDPLLAKLIAWADRCSNQRLSAFASLYKGISSFMLDDYEDSICHLEKARVYFQATDDYALTEKALLIKAQWYRLKNSYQQSLTLLRSAECKHAAYSESRSPELLLERARIARLQSSYEKANILLDLVIKTSENCCDYRTLAAAYHERGMIHRLNEQFSDSSDALKKAECIYRSEGNNQGMANVLFEQGQNEALTGHRERSAQILDSALEHYRLAGNLFGMNNVFYEQAKLLAGIDSPLIDQMRISPQSLEKAEGLLDKADTFYQQIESIIDMANVVLVRSKIAYVKRDFLQCQLLMNKAVEMYRRVNAKWGVQNVRSAARERNIKLQQ